MTENKALQGLKVVDFGWVLVSPLTVKTLADYGATAICVESISSPSLSRTGTPYKDGKPGINRSGSFAFSNANKYSISLDFRNPAGMEIARKLVAWADILSENRRAGIMKAMGLDYEKASEINPSLIMVSSSNQGQTGPYAKHPGLGIHLIGLGGFNNYIGYPGQDAITLTVAYTDYLTPPLSIATIMGALDYREKTGKGQYIDISQLEAGLHFQGTPILDYNINGRQPQFVANKCENAAPHNTYKCKGEDRWCAIAVFNDNEWAALCTVLNHPELINDPRFDTLEKRKQNEDTLNQTIESITINYTPEELMDSLQTKEIAAGVVKNARDIYEDVQLRAREYFWPMNHPEMGEFTHSGQPAILSKTPAKPVMPAPCIGEHTEYICKELLGMDDEEFITNMAMGAFGF